MIKFIIIIVLVVIAFWLTNKNKKLYRAVRNRRRERLDRLSEPPEE